jgi:hypothetical protein
MTGPSAAISEPLAEDKKFIMGIGNGSSWKSI